MQSNTLSYIFNILIEKLNEHKDTYICIEKEQQNIHIYHNLIMAL